MCVVMAALEIRRGLEKGKCMPVLDASGPSRRRFCLYIAMNKQKNLYMQPKRPKTAEARNAKVPDPQKSELGAQKCPQKIKHAA